MQSTVETLTPTRVRLAVEIPHDELEPGVAKVYRELAGMDLSAWRGCRLPFEITDRRLGCVVLPEALERAVLAGAVAAACQHGRKPLGRPEVTETGWADGRPLTFTAIVEVRPTLALPDLSALTVDVGPVEIYDTHVDEQVDLLRERFATVESVDRPAGARDEVRVELSSTVDRLGVAGPTGEVSHLVGGDHLPDGLDPGAADADLLLDALDAAVTGLCAGQSRTVPVPLAAGGEAALTAAVRSVGERRRPELDDGFAARTGTAATVAELHGAIRDQLVRSARADQLREATRKVLRQIVAAAAVPVPDGLVHDEVQVRKRWMLAELERVGTSLDGHLAATGKAEEEIDAELLDATVERLRSQLALDAIADAERIGVAEDEYRSEIAQRAKGVRVPAQTYHDWTVRTGAAGGLVDDIRRAKALAIVMQHVTIRDTNGTAVSPDGFSYGSDGQP